MLIQLSQLTNCTDEALKLKYAIEAKETSSKIKWSRGVLKSNAAIGNIYFFCSKNYPKSITYYEAAAEIAKNENCTNEFSLSLVYIAKNHEALGQHDESIRYLMKALTLNASAAINMGALGDLGVIYSNIGDYKHALECYNRSLQLLDDNVLSKKGAGHYDTVTKGGIILNIGDIYLSMSQPERALENYEAGYRIAETVKEPSLKFFSVMGISKAYYFRKQYSESIKQFELALADSRTLKQPMYEAEILCHLANAFMATGLVETAWQYAAASLKIAESNGFNEQLPKTYTALGKLLSQQNKNDSSVAYLQKALAYSRRLKVLEDEKNAWEALSITYINMSQTAKAFDAYRNFINLRDSMYSIDKANELVRIDLQAGFNRKQFADSLRQSNTYEIKMQKQRVLTYSGYIGLALLAVLSFFAYRNYNIQKKYNALLAKEKVRHLAHIEEQTNVLTGIAYTQSHEIRGPISTLLGLVEIFNHDDPADPQNREILEGITSVTQRLDKVVTAVVKQENDVHQKGKFES